MPRFTIATEAVTLTGSAGSSPFFQIINPDTTIPGAMIAGYVKPEYREMIAELLAADPTPSPIEIDDPAGDEFGPPLPLEPIAREGAGEPHIIIDVPQAGFLYRRCTRCGLFGIAADKRFDEPCGGKDYHSDRY